MIKEKKVFAVFLAFVIAVCLAGFTVFGVSTAEAVSLKAAQAFGVFRVGSSVSSRLNAAEVAGISRGLSESFGVDVSVADGVIPFEADDFRVILVEIGEDLCIVTQRVSTGEVWGVSGAPIEVATCPATPMGSYGPVMEGESVISIVFPDSVNAAELVTSSGITRQVPITNNIARVDISNEKEIPTLKWVVDNGKHYQSELWRSHIEND